MTGSAATRRILVAGCSGLVGRHCVRRAKAAGMNVVTASHNRDIAADFAVDLATADFGGLAELPGDVSHALVCGAISDIDLCRRSLDASTRFNVDNTWALIELLLARDIVPVFFSSDAVFRGDRGDYRETDDKEPMTAYGQQKAEIEDRLASCGRPFLVLRLGKQVEATPDDASPLGALVRSLSEDRPVRAAHDQWLSLTDVRDAAEAVTVLVNADASGIYHVANPKPVTRLDMAEAVADFLGKQDLVEPVSIDAFDFLEPPPKNPVLNTELFSSRFGFTFRDPLEDLDAWIGQ